MPGTAADRRVNSLRDRRAYIEYEDGSAVRRLNAAPELEREQRALERREQVLRARKRNSAIGSAYVAFLAVICVITTVLCVLFLQQKSQLITLTDEVAVMESQYTKLKGDNDARYNQVVSSFTLEDVKDAALNRLDMHYATADQIEYYTLDQDSYVRQYKDVDLTQ